MDGRSWKTHEKENPTGRAKLPIILRLLNSPGVPLMGPRNSDPLSKDRLYKYALRINLTDGLLGLSPQSSEKGPGEERRKKQNSLPYLVY